MRFCWFTSFIGYPSFFQKDGAAADLARAFLTFVQAAFSGTSYAESKNLFPKLDRAQVETKKAAFQEFGLLYVVARSDVLSVTPLGAQVYKVVTRRKVTEKDRRTVLLALGRGLSRYQFNNPIPVGGSRGVAKARSSDVLPYLACYYLMLKLDGIITASEMCGAVFALQQMSNLRSVEESIRKRRAEGRAFKPLSSIPENPRTADNLRIYLMSHLSLANEIANLTDADYYGAKERALELTQYGYEIIESVVSEQWPEWVNRSSAVPCARSYHTEQEYFTEGVGQACPVVCINADVNRAIRESIRLSEGVIDQYDIEDLKDLPKRSFEEGRRRLVQHAKLEKVRNCAFVREAKRLFKLERGKLFCEVCGFDFEKKYASRGKDYIEAHHKTPISEISSLVTLNINDLAMVCSNCHRMLHRPPWITIEELRDTVHGPSCCHE